MILDEFGRPAATLPATTKQEEKALAAVPYLSGGWIPVVRESYPGAWQRNITISRETVLAFHAVYACITLIASDISKLRVKLIQQQGQRGIWKETKNPAYSPVLRKPNHYQNRIQFWEFWILSKLVRGNTYVLKQRDARGVVVAMHVLDPARCRPMIADDGSVFYEASTDNLANIQQTVMIPAREIIHDRANCLFHPLVGMSPIFANGLVAMQGTAIQTNSQWFFENRSMPGGILTAPGTITETTADRLKQQWTDQFSGVNVGKIAVLGDGLKFEKQPIISPVDAQLIEQLKWTAEVVCSTFHVPPYKIGVGSLPSYNSVEALNVEYYSQCLQKHIEDAELCLDEGLALAEDIGVQFDLDGLLRMDSVSLVTMLNTAVSAGIMAPNEGRFKLDLEPKTGGDSPYLQQQNYSLEALAKRDAQADPFKPASPPPAEPDEEEPANDDDADDADDKAARKAKFSEKVFAFAVA